MSTGLTTTVSTCGPAQELFHALHVLTTETGIHVINHHAYRMHPGCKHIIGFIFSTAKMRRDKQSSITCVVLPRTQAVQYSVNFRTTIILAVTL